MEEPNNTTNCVDMCKFLQEFLQKYNIQREEIELQIELEKHLLDAAYHNRKIIEIQEKLLKLKNKR